MKRKHRKKPDNVVKIAEERISKLFKQAKSSFKRDSKLSDRYVQLARKIAMRYKVKLTSSQKRKFCRNCHKYLMPSVNCRVRIKDGKLIYYCLGCKHYTRISYK